MNPWKLGSEGSQALRSPKWFSASLGWIALLIRITRINVRGNKIGFVIFMIPSDKNGIIDSHGIISTSTGSGAIM
jgi:hypothetical protein